MAKRKTSKQQAKNAPQGLRVLFIHQNFPSPFLNLARHLTTNPHNVVAAVGQIENLQYAQPVPGALLFGYPASLLNASLPDASLPDANLDAEAKKPTSTRTLTRNFEHCVQRGKAAKTVFEQLAEANFTPNCIIGDPSWGEMLFVRQVFPHTPILARAECYFDLANPIWNFDPESPYGAEVGDELCTGQMAALRGWAEANARYSATHAQCATFPPLLRAGIEVMHEGIRTDVFKPGPARTITLPPHPAMHMPDNAPLPSYVPHRAKALALEPKTELVVYFSRVLEPHRGYHTFMRALPAILKRCPKAHVVIVGRTHGSYGPSPNPALHGKNANWRDVFLQEVQEQLDFTRTHFVGNVSDATALALMQRARAFVAPSCLPVPSWSPLEAMACGAPLISTNSVPMRELTNNGKCALLTNFFDAQELADAVVEALGNQDLRHRLAGQGRAFMLENYDFSNVCLPRWNAAIQRII